MKKFFCLLVVVCATMRLAAQSTETTQTAQATTVAMPIEDEDIVMEIFGKNKEALMQDYLRISPLETKSFQEALFDYENEKRPWQAERLALLKMYNEEFASIDERKMNSLTKQLMSNDMEYSHLQLRYFRRMNKLLGATRAAKFFQLDSYFEQSTKAYIQNNLPFIKELESDRQISMKDKPVSIR